MGNSKLVLNFLPTIQDGVFHFQNLVARVPFGVKMAIRRIGSILVDVTQHLCICRVVFKVGISLGADISL